MDRKEVAAILGSPLFGAMVQLFQKILYDLCHCGPGFDDTVPIGVILGLYWGYIGIMEKKMETTI